MKKVIYVLALLTLLLLPVHSTYAWNGSLDGRVVVGQGFTLKSGETMDGDLVVIGGEVTIENNATVNGDVVLIGGSLKLDGKVTGSTVVIGGVAAMGATSQVGGDMVTVGGSLQRVEGAEIGGSIVTNLSPTITIPPLPINPPSAPQTPKVPQFEINTSPFGNVISILAQAILISILAMALMLFLHPQLDRVAQTIVAQPFMAGTVGLLTAMFAPIALVILVVTLILIPVALAGIFLLVLAWLFGVIAIGVEFGDRFTKAIHQSWAPVLSAGFGTFILMLIVGTVNTVPCIGWLASVIVGLVGTGAVMMTMFGTRSATGPGISASTPAPVAAPDNIIPPAS